VFIEALQARLLNRGDVDENVLTAAIGLDEAETLGGVEPLDRAGRHIASPKRAFQADAPRRAPVSPAGRLVQAKELARVWTPHEIRTAPTFSRANPGRS